MLRQVALAIALTFRGPGYRRSYLIALGLGTVVTAFYLVMLPSPAVGGFSLAALQYLKPSLAIAAAALGYGFALAIAINIGAFDRRSHGAEVVGLGGLLAAVLPGSLCCTSLVPSLLATLGASAPMILGTTGKIQSIFALHEGAFIGASLIGVALSLLLAVRNRVATCSLT